MELNKDYNLAMFINLLTKPKGWEWKLTEAMENMFQSSELKFAKYKYYDFHEECRGGVRLDPKLEISQSFARFDSFD